MRDIHFIDIDIIFENTNQNYYYLLGDLGIPQSFDLRKRNNKRLYTHTFLKTFMEFLKENDPPYYFYSNTSTKDKVRNTLIGKLKRIFKISIWEESYDLQTFQKKIQRKDCEILNGVELFFHFKKAPNFKKIKKHLEKEGLTYLNDVYFEDLSNKLALFTK